MNENVALEKDLEDRTDQVNHYAVVVFDDMFGSNHKLIEPIFPEECNLFECDFFVFYHNHFSIYLSKQLETTVTSNFYLIKQEKM